MAPVKPVANKKSPVAASNTVGGHRKASAPMTIKKKIPPPPPKVAKAATPVKAVKAPVSAPPKSVESNDNKLNDVMAQVLGKYKTTSAPQADASQPSVELTPPPVQALEVASTPLTTEVPVPA